MITIPNQFKETRIPGYFWNIDQKELYSVKRGTLSKLAKQTTKPEPGKKIRHYYSISHCGKKFAVCADEFTHIKHLNPDSTFPVSQYDTMMADYWING
jgi:hypothetical protein